MSAVPQTHLLLSARAYSRIDRETAKFPAEQRRSAVMAALAIGRRTRLVVEGSDGKGRRLSGMPPLDRRLRSGDVLQHVHLKSGRRPQITICTNLPCALSGATRAAEHLKQRLGIGFGETTADGAFTLKEGECFGACGDAPVLLINNKRMESFMSNEKLDALLSELELAAR